MIKRRIYGVVLAAGAVAVMLPSAMKAQDPNTNPGSSPYSAGSPNLNQPSGPGVNAQTGQQNNPGLNTQPGSLGAPGQTGQEMIDKQFMRNAEESSIADMQIGKLATVKGGSSVQGLAQKLVDDHATMGKQMDNVADSLGVMVPKKMNKEHQKEYDKLNGLTGKDFDTEYLSYIATARYQDLHSYHMEAAVAANPDLAAEVVREMGTMHQHLGLIQSAAKEEGIALPARPQRPGTNTATK